MKKLVIALFILSSITATAQKKDSIVEGFVTHYIGLSFKNNDFKNLNNKLATYNSLYNTVAKSYIGMHLGFNVIAPKTLSKFDFNFATNGNGDAAKKSTKSSLLDVSYTLGVNIYKTNRFMLAPYAGIGVNSCKVVLNKDLSNISIDSILLSGNAQQNTESIKLANFFGYYKAGVSFYILDKKYHHPMIEFDLGYSASFKAYSWKMNEDQTIANSPKDNLGLYQIAMLLYFNDTSIKGKHH